MKQDKQLLDELNQIKLVDKITALAYILGIITGIILASFLHKYIVHPLGW